MRDLIYCLLIVVISGLSVLTLQTIEKDYKKLIVENNTLIEENNKLVVTVQKNAALQANYDNLKREKTFELCNTNRCKCQPKLDKIIELINEKSILRHGDVRTTRPNSSNTILDKRQPSRIAPCVGSACKGNTCPN